MALDLTSFDPVLKQHYVKQRVIDLADLNNVFLSRIRKNTKAGGRHIVQPVHFRNPVGGAGTFSKALANAGASGYEDFVIPRRKNYVVANIDNETIEASKGDANAFLPAFTEIDYAFNAAGNRLAHQLYRTDGGKIGRIESGTALGGTLLQLDDIADAFNFQVGMINTFAAADGTGSERGAPDTNTVNGIDRELGQISYASVLSSVTGITDTDFVFADGDFAATMAGLESWLPPTAPSATLFFGVDRTQDSDRLGGIRRQAQGEPLDETLQKLTSTLTKHGSMPDVGYMNPEVLSDLLLLIGTKSRYNKTIQKGRASFGFTGFEVQAAGRTVTLFGDVRCPSTRLYILQEDTWTLHSAGETPMFLQRDNLLQRSATADEYEVRTGGYQNTGSSAPGYSAVGVLT